MAMNKRESILIIEDEAKIAEIISGYLQREGFSVMTASTGKEALKLLSGPIDLVILDLMLPDMDGEDICRLIREGSDVPVIMLTAKSAEEDKIRGLGIGADDYVIKPFSPRELVARVNAHLRRAGRTRRRALSFNEGLLKIDVGTRDVFRDGRQVFLTPTEFKILLSLSDNPGMVFTREQLVNLVQGFDFDGYDRTIDAHVKNLRHKIEKDSRDPDFIRTVYGVGYKFIGKADED